MAQVSHGLLRSVSSPSLNRAKSRRDSNSPGWVHPTGSSLHRVGHEGCRSRELASNEVGNGDHLPLAPVPAGSCFGGLDERIGSFEQAVTDATCMPGDDPVPVFFDGLDKLLQRLESRTLCAVAPVAEIRLGSLLWLVVERLEVFTPTQCTRCGQTHRRTSQPGPRLPLLCRQVCLVLQPDIPGLLEQWVVSLLNPADVVDRLRQQLHDVEAIERHLRIREVVTDAGDEGVGHVRTGPCDQLGVATVGYQISRKCLDGAGITAFDAN